MTVGQDRSMENKSTMEVKVRDLISIITPCHNAADTIAETIESVLAQTYQNWEMIVVDDCSTDNSTQIIEEYCEKDPRIKTIRLDRNGGPAKARNAATEAAKGRYIAFLDGDDMWLPEKLQRQLDFMNTHNLILSYTAYRKIDARGNIGTRVVGVPKHARHRTLLFSNYIPCLTAMYDTASVGKHFMPDLRLRQDYALWLNILKTVGHEDYGFWLSLADRIARLVSGASRAGGEPNKKNTGDRIIGMGLDEPLALYRVGPGSLSGNKIKSAVFHWLVLRKLEKLSFVNALFHYAGYTYFGYKKYRIF
jgi:teichuronic acid biosynthesis glycosyltransferase TuaG